MADGREGMVRSPVVLLLGCCGLGAVAVMALVLFYLLVLKQPPTTTGRKKFTRVGKPGKRATYQVLAGIVTLAITKSKTELAKAIDKAKITFVTKADNELMIADIRKALVALNTNKAKAVAALMKLPYTPAACALFVIAARKEMVRPVIPKVPPPAKDPLTDETTLACPTKYGYKNCTDPEYNDGYREGATVALNNRLGNPANKPGFVSARKFCCKSTNASGDPNPAAQRAVKKAQKGFFVGMIIASLITIPLGFLLPGAMSFGTSLAASLAMEIPFFTGQTLTAIAQQSMVGDGEFTMVSCQGPQQDKLNPRNKSIVTQDFKDENGQDSFGMYMTHNGCPIMVASPNSVTYAHQVGLAAGVLNKIAQSGKNISGVPDPMYPVDKWDPNGPAISCVEHPPNDNPNYCSNSGCQTYDIDSYVDNCSSCSDPNVWTCGQYSANPDLIGGGWTNGYTDSVISPVAYNADRPNYH